MNSKKIKWEDLTLSDNYLFQTYMEKEENCKKLLTEILGRPVRKIEYSGFEESYKAKLEAKGIRLDVYKKGSKGKVSNYLKTFLNAVDGVFDSSELSAKIKEEVDEIKYSDKWREEYMFQEVHDQDMMLKGKRITVLKMVRDGDITIDRAGEILKMDVKELQKLLKEDYDKE